MRKKINRHIALKTDSYKVCHWSLLPPDTKEMFYYQEPRIPNKEIKVFGAQEFVMKHLMEVPTKQQIDFSDKFWTEHGEPFNRKGWDYISDLGYFPVEMRAVPEGMVIPSQNIINSFRSTDENVPWTAGWLETLAMQLWYPTTACTISYECKKILQKWLELTGTPEEIEFKLHDFGYRGATCNEAAGIYGLAHLMNFMGTDNPMAILDGQEFYNTIRMLGFSIPASEHSTVISWGYKNEEAAYKNMLDQYGIKGKLFANVFDSYDLSHAIRNMVCGSLRQQIIDCGCTLVVRPDSGDPSKVVVRTLQELEEGFGTSLIKGYKVLAPSVRIIQGDGITGPKAIDTICQATADAGFSIDNVNFGSGMGLAQGFTRDTLMFAEKNSAIKRGNTWYDVCKNPKDAPWKASKAGQLDLTPEFKTVNINDYNGPSVMQTIFRNGKLLVDESFETIRARS